MSSRPELEDTTWWHGRKISASVADISPSPTEEPEAAMEERQASARRRSLHRTQGGPSWLLRAVVGSLWTHAGQVLLVWRRSLVSDGPECCWLVGAVKRAAGSGGLPSGSWRSGRTSGSAAEQFSGSQAVRWQFDRDRLAAVVPGPLRPAVPARARSRRSSAKDGTASSPPRRRARYAPPPENLGGSGRKRSGRQLTAEKLAELGRRL
jgi:hypothetical protein